jgi:hypothetical protein
MNVNFEITQMSVMTPPKCPDEFWAHEEYSIGVNEHVLDGREDAIERNP